MATLFRTLAAKKPTTDDEPGGQMSFLEHLDELRSRLIHSIIFVIIAAMGCWFLSDRIYRFLAVPVERALADAQRQQAPISGITNTEAISPLGAIKEENVGRYVFTEETKLGNAVIPSGTSVAARYTKDSQGQLGLFTDEQIYVANTMIPKGVRLPVDLNAPKRSGLNDRLIVTTAIEPFSLYVKVSLYAAVCLSVPFLLYQIWAFVSPGLFPHERGYVVPFLVLSSVSFVGGAIFAYEIIFPPAAKYLLGLGHDFRLLLKADDYFDFIIMIMLGMGVVFQMPAVAYVLARIGIVTAGFLLRVWKISVVVILIVAAVISPTNDIPNMMLFAAPMLGLYVVSIFVAWIFGKPRRSS
jgi:sec-independent protein translocase protein TatC